MIDSRYRTLYQKLCIDPFLPLVNKCHPMLLTLVACATGVAILPLLAFHFHLLALVCLALSGFLDTLDGSLARYLDKTSPLGAALDIISDRVVEFAILLGLFFCDPLARAFPCLLMTGSCLICITSFLVVGIFTANTSEKSFHYSPGLIERAEAFLFFAAMIAFPGAFSLLALSFSCLVMLTALLRIAQFALCCRSELKK